MPVATLEDVASYNAYQRKKLADRVREASEAVRSWRPSPGKWSLLEHLEHVALSAAHFADLFEERVNWCRQTGLKGDAATPRTVDAILAFLAAGNANKKRKAPPEYEPAGRSLEEILALLQQHRRRAIACAAALPELDTDAVQIYLPVADITVNLAQFWHFHGIHEAHHGRLMDENLKAWAEAQQPLGEVAAIFLAQGAGKAMTTVTSATAIAGSGLEADRYFRGTGYYSHKPGPDRHVTLIAAEVLAELANVPGLDLAPGEHRRNLVTRGVDLNALVGQEFSVGPVRLRGIRPCEPCAYIEELTGRAGLLKALVGKGGLRAQILAGGLIREGDPVTGVQPARP